MTETIDTKLKIDSFKIFAGLASPDISVNIIAGGKNISLRGNRRDLMKILREASEAVFAMEPGR